MTRRTDFPGLVLVFEPAFNGFRVFQTGGTHDTTLWRHGLLDGKGFYQDLPDNWRKVGRGVYAVDETQFHIPEAEAPTNPREGYE